MAVCVLFFSNVSSFVTMHAGLPREEELSPGEGRCKACYVVRGEEAGGRVCSS